MAKDRLDDQKRWKEENCIFRGVEPYYQTDGNNGRLLVREIPEKEKITSGGVVMPQSFKSSHKLFEVCAVSYNSPPDFRKGTVVMTGVYSGLEFDLGGEKVSLIGTGDVLGIVHGASG